MTRCGKPFLLLLFLAIAIGPARQICAQETGGGIRGVTPLPEKFFELDVLTRTDPPPGYYLFSGVKDLFIADNLGVPVFMVHYPEEVTRFDLHPGERYSYYRKDLDAFLLTDPYFIPQDTFRVIGDCLPDFHVFELADNGHAYLVGIDPVLMDLSTVVPGGQANATVLAQVIQEVDAEGNLLWEWKSLDHIPVTDAATCLVSLTQSTVDYIHLNSVSILPGGDLLVSSRNLSEVFRIRKETGEILWRMGGAQNEFSFTGDEEGFSGQHSASLVDDSLLLLFDNGNCHDVMESAGKIYIIDEAEKTAKLWYVKYGMDQAFSPIMGNFYRTDDATYLTGWLSGRTDHLLTECAGDETVLAMNFRDGDLQRSFQVKKSASLPHIIGFDADSLKFSVSVPADQDRQVLLTNPGNRDLSLLGFHTHTGSFTVAQGFPMDLPAGGSVQLTLSCTATEPGNYTYSLSLFASW